MGSWISVPAQEQSEQGRRNPGSQAAANLVNAIETVLNFKPATETANPYWTTDNPAVFLKLTRYGCDFPQREVIWPLEHELLTEKLRSAGLVCSGDKRRTHGVASIGHLGLPNHWECASAAAICMAVKAEASAGDVIGTEEVQMMRKALWAGYKAVTAFRRGRIDEDLSRREEEWVAVPELAGFVRALLDGRFEVRDYWGSYFPSPVKEIFSTSFSASIGDLTSVIIPTGHWELLVQKVEFEVGNEENRQFSAAEIIALSAVLAKWEDVEIISSETSTDRETVKDKWMVELKALANDRVHCKVMHPQGDKHWQAQVRRDDLDLRPSGKLRTVLSRLALMYIYEEFEGVLGGEKSWVGDWTIIWLILSLRGSGGPFSGLSYWEIAAEQWLSRIGCWVVSGRGTAYLIPEKVAKVAKKEAKEHAIAKKEMPIEPGEYCVTRTNGCLCKALPRTAREFISLYRDKPCDVEPLRGVGKSDAQNLEEGLERKGYWLEKSKGIVKLGDFRCPYTPEELEVSLGIKPITVKMKWTAQRQRDLQKGKIRRFARKLKLEKDIERIDDPGRSMLEALWALGGISADTSHLRSGEGCYLRADIFIWRRGETGAVFKAPRRLSGDTLSRLNVFWCL